MSDKDTMLHFSNRQPQEGGRPCETSAGLMVWLQYCQSTCWISKIIASHNCLHGGQTACFLSGSSITHHRKLLWFTRMRVSAASSAVCSRRPLHAPTGASTCLAGYDPWLTYGTATWRTRAAHSQSVKR